LFIIEYAVDFDTMLDLSRLGHELRTRRRALRIPSAELARRIGVSPTYIWLIEQAKPRQGGEPSRPSEDLLSRWMAALGMTESDAQRIRELAGYFGPAVLSQQNSAPDESSYTTMYSDKTIRHALARDDVGQELGQGSRYSSDQRVASQVALRQWAGAKEIDDADETILLRVQEVIQRAARNGRGEEVNALLNSFLSWLEFHAGRGW
jgi:transcriptional regulator with XRE-family HTH domain